MLTCQHSAAVFMSLSAALRMWDTVPSSKGFCSSAAITFHQKANIPFKTPVNHPHLPSRGCLHHTHRFVVSERSRLQKSAPTHSASLHHLLQAVRFTFGEDAFVICTQLWRTWQVFLMWERERENMSTVKKKNHCWFTDSFFPPSRDLIKKFLVIDRARRLGNMKVSRLDFMSLWTTWQPTIFHPFSR